MGWLGDILSVAAPIAGSIIAPGIGTAIGGAVGSAIQGAGKQGKANKLNQQALDRALADYNARAPLRTQAIQLAQAPIGSAPDLSRLFQNTGNPYQYSGVKGPERAYIGGQAADPAVARALMNRLSSGGLSPLHALASNGASGLQSAPSVPSGNLPRLAQPPTASPMPVARPPLGGGSYGIPALSPQAQRLFR